MKGGLNSKLRAVCDGDGKPLVMLLSEGQMSDQKGARLMLGVLPKAKTLIADPGYDSNWFREALKSGESSPAFHQPKAARRRSTMRDNLPPAPQNREPLRQAQGLAAHRNALRPMRPHILLRRLHRCYSRLLSQSMSPEPRWRNGPPQG